MLGHKQEGKGYAHRHMLHSGPIHRAGRRCTSKEVEYFLLCVWLEPLASGQCQHLTASLTDLVAMQYTHPLTHRRNSVPHVHSQMSLEYTMRDSSLNGSIETFCSVMSLSQSWQRLRAAQFYL